MKRLAVAIAVLAIPFTACDASDEPNAIYSPIPGLECPSEQWWSETGSLAADAVGFATPDEAISEGLKQWADVPNSEVVVMDAFVEGIAPAAGVVVSDGRRVVVAYPTEVPAGGWLIDSVFGCADFDLLNSG